jgi:hypothetical protein
MQLYAPMYLCFLLHAPRVPLLPSTTHCYISILYISIFIIHDSYIYILYSYCYMLLNTATFLLVYFYCSIVGHNLYYYTCVLYYHSRSPSTHSCREYFYFFYFFTHVSSYYYILAAQIATGLTEFVFLGFFSSQCY